MFFLPMAEPGYDQEDLHQPKEKTSAPLSMVIPQAMSPRLEGMNKEQDVESKTSMSLPLCPGSITAQRSGIQAE